MRLTIPRLLALAALAFAAASCADYTPVVVTGFYGLSASPTGCTASSTLVVNGVLDTSRGSSYVVGIGVQNLLSDNTDKNRTNTNQVIIDTLKVSYRAGTGASFGAPAPATIHQAVVVPPSATSTFPAEILAPDSGEGLQSATGELIADVTLSGHYGDGTAFVTPKVSFPVQLCVNCVKPCDADKTAAGCSGGQPDGFICQ